MIELLLPQSLSYNDITMEIHSAVGGKESMLFAYEVFVMYRNLAYNNGWDFNDTDFSSDEKGRNNFITLKVNHGTFKIYIPQRRIQQFGPPPPLDPPMYQ